MSIKGLKVNNTTPIGVGIPVDKYLTNPAVYNGSTPLNSGSGTLKSIKSNLFKYNSQNIEPYRLIVGTTESSKITFICDAPTVAIANETGYTRLADALNKAKDGETVTLLKDISEGSAITVKNSKHITLDLKGHTYTSSVTGKAVEITDNSSFTVKNGNFKFTGQQGSLPTAIYVHGESAALYMENVTLSDEKKQAAIMSGSTNGTIQLKNCDITSQSGYALYHNGSTAPVTITVENSTLTTNAADYPAIFISNSYGKSPHNLTITNSTLTGESAIEVKHANATITNSKLAATYSDVSYNPNGSGTCTHGYCLAICKNESETATSGTITLSGNTYKAVSGCELFREADGATINGYDDTIFTSTYLKPDASGSDSSSTAPET